MSSVKHRKHRKGPCACIPDPWDFSTRETAWSSWKCLEKVCKLVSLPDDSILANRRWIGYPLETCLNISHLSITVYQTAYANNASTTGGNGEWSTGTLKIQNKSDDEALGLTVVSQCNQAVGRLHSLISYVKPDSCSNVIKDSNNC